MKKKFQIYPSSRTEQTQAGQRQHRVGTRRALHREDSSYTSLGFRYPFACSYIAFSSHSDWLFCIVHNCRACALQLWVSCSTYV